jgi:transposase
MSRPSPYPAELRQRAVRTVAEVRPNYDSDWAAITAVAQKLGIGTAETLRKWVRQAEVGQAHAGTPEQQQPGAPENGDVDQAWGQAQCDQVGRQFGFPH